MLLDLPVRRNLLLLLGGQLAYEVAATRLVEPRIRCDRAELLLVRVRWSLALDVLLTAVVQLARRTWRHRIRLPALTV